MLGMLTTMAWQHSQDAGYPLGGSLAFSQAIERRYLDLGGEIRYKSRVEEILVENDQAVGVRLANGTEQRADVVISAADGHATIFDMLAGKYADDRVRGYYDELPIFRPMIQVSLGVARDLSDEPHMVNFALEEPVTIGGEVRERLSARHYCYDPSLAPEGKSVLVSLLESDYGYWQGLYQDPARYGAEKEEVAESIIGGLEQRFPGLRQDIEVVDVATPMTYERFTGNWQGSMEGWLLTTKTISMTMGRGMPKTLPGLDRLYMAGQWVEPGGGVPTAAMSGRRVIQMICKEDGKRFETQIP
jgi:phytoene dehydrogenase-like protein